MKAVIEIHILFFLELIILLQLTHSASWNDSKKEHEKLSDAYSVSNEDYYSDIIPTTDLTQPLEVKLALELYAIGGYDAVSGALNVMGSLEMSWTDGIVHLQGVTFDADNVPEIVFDYRKIWTPVIVLMNSADSVERVGGENYKVRMNLDTGLVVWKPRMIIKSSCTPDVKFFPFDQQQCDFTFKPWFQDSSKVKLTVSSNTWNLDNYDVNGVWEISSTEAKTSESGNYYIATFTIVIKRAPTYFTFNLVLPILMLSVLSGMLFLLPAASGERTGFGITCFLSFVVLLQTTMNYLPQISSPMSLLCYYLIVMIMFTAFLSIVNILLLIVYHQPNHKDVPRWMIKFIELIKFVKCRRKFCKRKPNVFDDKSVSGSSTDKEVSQRFIKFIELINFLKSRCKFCQQNPNAVDYESASSSSSIKADLEKGLLMKTDKEMPTKVAFNHRRVSKIEEELRDTRNEEDIEKPPVAWTGRKAEITQISVLPASSEFESSTGANVTTSAGKNSKKEPSKDDENETDVNWEAVGRILDFFFLIVFFGVEGTFSFFFLVPLGTKY